MTMMLKDFVELQEFYERDILNEDKKNFAFGHCIKYLHMFDFFLKDFYLKNGF